MEIISALEYPKFQLKKKKKRKMNKIQLIF